MELNKIKDLVDMRGGVMKLTHTEVVNAYQAIKQRPMRGNCSDCAIRQARMIILNFIKKQL